jgi:hypothetical protein
VGKPVQDPLLVESVCPNVDVPETEGDTVLTGIVDAEIPIPPVALDDPAPNAANIGISVILIQI